MIHKNLTKIINIQTENAHEFSTKFIINSINNFDYGVYACKASNLIGDSMKQIKLERKSN